MRLIVLLTLFLTKIFFLSADIPLYYWEPDNCTNFGDTISKILIEKMTGQKVKKSHELEKKLLAIGSILQFAIDGDVVWGSGINGKHPSRADYLFSNLDVRAVRGPLTRKYLIDMGIKVPRVYGDPALLFAKYFPEFKPNPKQEFLVIPHISEMHLFKPSKYVAFPTEPWNVIIQKIVESELVISSSLHVLILADAYGIPARLLRITENEPLFKYTDYYLGTKRPFYKYAKTVLEALNMGGEPPPICDLDKLEKAFPTDIY